MSQESLDRARLALRLREAEDALSRLEDERLRLARKNELLAQVLHEVRAAHALPELALLAIDRALAFDGQPWSLPEDDEQGEGEGEEDGESEP